MHMYGCTCISWLTATSRFWYRSFQGQVYSKGELLANGCQIEVCFVYYNLLEDVKGDKLVAKIVQVHYIEKSSRLLFASWQKVLIILLFQGPKKWLAFLPIQTSSLVSLWHFCLIGPLPWKYHIFHSRVTCFFSASAGVISIFSSRLSVVCFGALSVFSRPGSNNSTMLPDTRKDLKHAFRKSPIIRIAHVIFEFFCEA